MRMYYDRDVDAGLIKSETVAVIGFGSQGHSHAHALNLRDSGGANVVVGLHNGSFSVKKAETAGLKVRTTAEAARVADIVMVLTPDEQQADLYRADLHVNMRPGTTLAFAHGLNVHFNLPDRRDDLDVFMVAPKALGHAVRSEFLHGGGTPCLVAVAQDRSGYALKTTLSYGCSIGGGRAGIIETSF